MRHSGGGEGSERLRIVSQAQPYGDLSEGMDDLGGEHFARVSLAAKISSHAAAGAASRLAWELWLQGRPGILPFVLIPHKITTLIKQCLWHDQ